MEFVKEMEHELDILGALRDGEKTDFNESDLLKSSEIVEYIRKFIKSCSSSVNLKLFGLNSKVIGQGVEYSIGAIYDYLRGPDLKKFIKSCENILDRRETNKKAFRKSLIEGCFEVCQSLEMQFMCLQSEMGYKIALQKFARYSAKRSIYFLMKNPNSIISKSIYAGNFDDDFKLEFYIGNRKIIIEPNSFYESPGIRITNNNSTKFYERKNNINNVKELGFRLLFSWEESKKVEEYYKIAQPLDAFVSYRQELEDSFKKEYTEIVLNKMQNLDNDIKPICFNVQILEKVYSRTDTDKTNEIFNMITDESAVAIVGPSGIGKTTMAIRYVEKYGKDINVIWLNATDDNTIKECIYRLCRDKLKIEVKDDQEYISLKIIFERVYEHYKNKSCIFIFDNAKKYSSIQDFLPVQTPYSEQMARVLITTTNSNEQDWLNDFINIKLLQLGGFNELESTTYLKNKLSIHDDSMNEELKSFSTKLKNYPMFLKFAAIDFKIKRDDHEKRKMEFNLKIYIEKYLHEFKSSMHEFLISILKKIEEAEYGQMALKMFHIMSYISSNQIPEEIFIRFIDNNNQDLQIKITNTLEKNSVVKFMNGLLNVHELLQEIDRSLLVSRDQEFEILKNILNNFILMIKAMEENSIKEKKKLDDELCKFIPHIISTWNHAITYTKKDECDVLDNVFVKEFITNDIIGKKPHLSFFHLLVGYSSYNIIESVLKTIPIKHHKAIINMKTHQTKKSSLHYAVESGCKNKVVLLISKAEINSKTNIKHTALHLAVKNNYLNIVDILVERNDLDINFTTTYGFTSLHYAAKMGNIEIIESLINLNANINAKTTYGFTALHLSSENGNFRVVEKLLENKNIEIDAVTNYNETSLLLAVRNGNERIVKILLMKQADPNLATNQKKFTPLHEAIVRKNINIVRILLADIRVSLEDDKLMDLAIETKSVEIINALKSRLKK